MVALISPYRKPRTKAREMTGPGGARRGARSGPSQARKAAGAMVRLSYGSSESLMIAGPGGGLPLRKLPRGSLWRWRGYDIPLFPVVGSATLLSSGFDLEQIGFFKSVASTGG